MKKKSIWAIGGNRIKVVILLMMLMLFSGCGIAPPEIPPEPPPEPTPKLERVKMEPTEVVKEVEASTVNIVAMGESSGSLGSGVIFSKDGYIVTNYHVIKGKKSIKVQLGKEHFDATVVGWDSRTDLAVLKIKGDNFKEAEFGDSDKVEKAEPVLAIGNAMGHKDHVTDGVISGLPDDVDDGENIKECLTTSAEINPGNSGGALANMYAKVIGINTMKRAKAEGIGYAIPSNKVKEIVQRLIDKGYVSYPYLGVLVENRETKNGELVILVTAVRDNSPAAKAGLKEGDIIVTFNGSRVLTVSELRKGIIDSKIGRNVSMGILRKIKQDFQQHGTEATLEEIPNSAGEYDWT